jgi:hypothetical protein
VEQQHAYLAVMLAAMRAAASSMCNILLALGVDPALKLLTLVGLFPDVSCRVDLQAVGLLPMWMMILSRAPLMILVFDP